MLLLVSASGTGDWERWLWVLVDQIGAESAQSLWLSLSCKACRLPKLLEVKLLNHTCPGVADSDPGLLGS